jgi:hypothetical protein
MKYMHHIAWICLFPLAWARGQEDPHADTIRNRFDRYQLTHLQEKIFVHTDRTLYLPGQVLWFKAYVLDAGDNRPLTLSKVAYVEVLDGHGRAWMQGKVGLTRGSGAGSFFIPPSVPTGNYRLRAYTNWMKNGNPDLFFQESLCIVNPLTDPPGPGRDTTAYDIQFFPEGGNLVAGLTSKVGFRMVDQTGRGISARGVVVDQQGDTAASFAPLVFGLGHFDLRPREGRTYSALIRVGDTVVARRLPPVFDKGYVMTVKDTTDDQWSVTVQTRGEGLSPYGYLLAGKVVNRLEWGVPFLLNKKTQKPGIVHLTVFSAEGEPLTERLSFVYPRKTLDIQATTDKSVYGAREKVQVDIKSDTGADLSLSVALADSLQGPEAADMVSYCWLRSDLRGNIESPGYYFDTGKPDREAALDNLLLTQGWSRWRWEDVLSPELREPRFLPEYEGHIVTGRVVNKTTEQPVAGIPVYLSLPGKYFKLAVAISDSTGYLRFNMQDFYGGSEIVLQVEQDSNYRVDINSPFSEARLEDTLPAFRFPTSRRDQLRMRSVNTQVMNAFPGSRDQRFVYTSDTLPFFGKPDAAYKLDDYTRFTTMEEIFREYVPEVNISKHRSDFSLSVFKDNERIFFGEAPLILLDGVPFFNEDTVVSFDPLKIRKMDVVTRRYYTGLHYFSGVISLSTYHNDLADFRLDPSALVVAYEGLQPEREMYTPIFGGSRRIPDLRDVLSWTPHLGGKASFYTSDIPGTFRGIIQGIGKDGLPGVRTFTFTVKP